MVRHDVLPAESGADVCVAAGIFLQHEQGRDLRALVPQLRIELEAGGWNADQGCAEDGVSVERRGGICCKPQRFLGICTSRARAGMEQSHGCLRQRNKYWWGEARPVFGAATPMENGRHGAD